MRTLQSFSQDSSVHKVSGVFTRASPGWGSASAEHGGFGEQKGEKKRPGGAGVGWGKWAGLGRLARGDRAPR